MAVTKRRKRRASKSETEVGFAVDRAKLAQIKRCLRKGDLRLSLKNARVVLTEQQGFVIEAYEWD